jgi:NAD(P) transhydrogenase subunit alpha
MICGICKESRPEEARVAVVPDALSGLFQLGLSILVAAGAGRGSHFSDEQYEARGAAVVDAREVWSKADLILKIHPPSFEEAQLCKEGSILVSFLYPALHPEVVRLLAAKKVTAFALELIPRISRAQSMDVLSSQATVAGYKAALLAAASLPKFFPMLMTAAGTIPPAKVLVLGAGVAGLQAMATARRLGALVEGYDIRPAAREQVESVGARFVELPLKAEEAEAAGGYARAQTEEFYRRQQELLAERCALVDAVITTALVPGRRAPVLVSQAAVEAMRPGSVIVDGGAEQGGNCALTVPGKTLVHRGVTIHGPRNLPSTLPVHASVMYSRNLVSFLSYLFQDGKPNWDREDEVVRSPLVLDRGRAVQPATRALLEEEKKKEPVTEDLQQATEELK